MNWQPIETAPKDGTWVIVQAGDGHPSTARWNTGSEKWENAANMLGYERYDYWPLDKWMPLPAAPVDDEQTPPSAAQAVQP